MSNIVKTGSAPVTMTSLEIVDFINDLRKEDALKAGAAFPSPGFAKLEHSDFTKKVPEVLGERAGNFSATYQIPGPNGSSRAAPCYRFPKREASLMAMSYSYKIQARVWDHMTALEEQLKANEATALEQPTKPARVSERYREAAAITRDQLKICKLLGVDEGMAKVIAAKEVRNATGLDFTPLLTNVTATNNPRVPVSELVKQIEGATSELINTALEELGFQIKERWTSRGKPRSKWVLTEAGKQYGALAPYQAEENAHSGLRPVWFASVLELVRPLVEVAIAQRAVAKARNTKPAKAPAVEPKSVAL